MSAVRAHAITTLRATEAIDIRALLDVPQPVELPLLARVRVRLDTGGTAEGVVVGRTHEAQPRYDVRTAARIYPDELREALTVLALPSEAELAEVIRS